MDIAAIKETCVDGAEKYLQYLEENKKGIQEVAVHEIEHKGSNSILKLRLSAKLFDTEYVFFKVFGKDQLYDTTQVKVIEYDADKNFLLINPTKAVEASFRSI